MTFPERTTIAPFESYRRYCARVLNLPDRSPELPHAYQILAALRKRAVWANSLKNRLIRDEWEDSFVIPPKIPINRKLKPMNTEYDFWDAVDMQHKIEEEKVEE